MLADLLIVGWIYLSVQAGLLVNRLVLQLDALAQGVIKAGQTFDGWIRSFEQSVPGRGALSVRFSPPDGRGAQVPFRRFPDLGGPGRLPWRSTCWR